MTVSSTKIHPTENQERECFRNIFWKLRFRKFFVIGDRKTDVELAKNLGSKSIFISDETNDEATFYKKVGTKSINILNKFQEKPK